MSQESKTRELPVNSIAPDLAGRDFSKLSYNHNQVTAYDFIEPITTRPVRGRRALYLRGLAVLAFAGTVLGIAGSRSNADASPAPLAHAGSYDVLDANGQNHHIEWDLNPYLNGTRFTTKLTYRENGQSSFTLPREDLYTGLQSTNGLDWEGALFDTSAKNAAFPSLVGDGIDTRPMIEFTTDIFYPGNMAARKLIDFKDPVTAACDPGKGVASRHESASFQNYRYDVVYRNNGVAHSNKIAVSIIFEPATLNPVSCTFRVIENTPTPSPSPTPSETPTPSPSPELTKTPSPSPELTKTPSPSPTPEATLTPTPTLKPVVCKSSPKVSLKVKVLDKARNIVQVIASFIAGKNCKTESASLSYPDRASAALEGENPKTNEIIDYDDNDNNSKTYTIWGRNNNRDSRKNSASKSTTVKLN